jgi:glycosyltransferase involved in cell wall biosynthesis
VLAVSENDQQALREVTGESASIEIVPITVDARRFEGIWATRDPQQKKLFTIGTMFWPPNNEGVIWWLREGYEHLQKDCPDIVYDVVGARPPQTLQALSKKYRGVQLHGYVADLKPFWKYAGALAVPILSGGGVRVKILEAMAVGMPVISTTIGCEGLAVRDGEHLLIADTPKAFASACAVVLQDPKLAQKLAQNARQLLLERYDRAVALRSLDAVYDRYQDGRH